jgi:hypothetical protein
VSDEEFKTVRQILWNFVPIENFGEALAELQAARRTVSRQEAGYREVGVWEPNGSKFKTYAKENLDGKAMYVRDAAPIPVTGPK